MPTQVTDIHEDVDTISFHVSEIGKPVSCARRTSRTGRRTARRARTALAPNLMVVVPTSHDVKLTYGLTAVDWLGRIVHAARARRRSAGSSRGRASSGTGAATDGADERRRRERRRR